MLLSSHHLSPSLSLSQSWNLTRVCTSSRTSRHSYYVPLQVRLPTPHMTLAGIGTVSLSVCPSLSLSLAHMLGKFHFRTLWNCSRYLGVSLGFWESNYGSRLPTLSLYQYGSQEQCASNIKETISYRISSHISWSIALWYSRTKALKCSLSLFLRVLARKFFAVFSWVNAICRYFGRCWEENFIALVATKPEHKALYLMLSENIAKRRQTKFTPRKLFASGRSLRL